MDHHQQQEEEEEEQQQQQQQQQHNYYRLSNIVWLFVAPALGGFLFGYDIGGTSYVVLELSSARESDGSTTSSPFSLGDDPLATGWFVAAPSGGALLGTAILLWIDTAALWKPAAAAAAATTTTQIKQAQPTTKERCSSMLFHWWGKLLRSAMKPMGRTTELWYAGILYALGGLLQFGVAVLATGSATTATTTTTQSIPPIQILRHHPFAILVLGRWIYGAGIGFAMHGGPTYLAETTPPSVRGTVVGAKEIAIVLGILCGYVMGNHLCNNTNDGNDDSNNNNNWAYVYGSTVPLAIAMIAFSVTIPESPRYLVSETHRRAMVGRHSSARNRDDDAEIENRNETEDNQKIEQLISSEVLESLRFVWHPKRAREEHKKLMELYRSASDKHRSSSSSSHHAQPPSPTLSLVSLRDDPSIGRALHTGLGLVVLQQVTGQPTVLSYATPILARVPGLGASAPVWLAVFKILATSVSVVLVEHHGRKRLLTAGCSLMLVALVVLVAAFSGDDSDSYNSDGDSDDYTHSYYSKPQPSLDAGSGFALVGMFAYIAGYQIGFGPITWLYISEIFPQSVRGTTMALAVQANFALNALVQLLVPVLQTKVLGMSRTFALFGGLTAYALWFVTHCVVETKGLTLEEIEEKLASMGTTTTTTMTTETTTAKDRLGCETTRLLLASSSSG